MTQLVSVAAMIPVMLPEDLKDYIFLLQHTDVADFLFTALAHGYQNVWGQSLPHSLLSSCNIWSGLEFREKDFWIWLIHLDHQGFFWFYVFYFILFFFSCFRGCNASCVLRKAITENMQIYHNWVISDH